MIRDFICIATGLALGTLLHAEIGFIWASIAMLLLLLAIVEWPA